MATDTPTIQFSNINFDEIKEDLKDYIKATTDFNTYNFDASNINLVVNLLSYVTTILNFYINQAVNENYIDSVRLRKNLLSIIKLLNYTPSRTTSSYVYVDLTATPTSAGTDVVIPRYSLFTAGAYNFYNTSELVFEQSESYTLSNVQLKEGIIKQETFTGNGLEFQEFQIDDTIVGDYLRVWSYELDDDNNETSIEEEWDLYTQSLSLPNPINAKIFFLEEIETGYKITTGNGSFGKIPDNGKSFNIDYLQSKGAEANGLGESDFSFSGTGTNLDTMAIAFSTDTDYLTTQSIGGTAKESIESIKFNAPKFYSTQGRAVTDDDYLAITIARSDVGKASVVGGDQLLPVQLGKVFIYAKPTESLNFTTTQLNTIREYLLGFSVVTINPVVANPEYIYFDISSTIRYTSNQPSSTDIITALDDYINSSIQEFGTYFKYSQFIDIINDADSLISSHLTTLKKFRFITADDEDTGNEFGVYLAKQIVTTGVQLYIEEWTKDVTPILNQTIAQASLASLVIDTDTGYTTFNYASFDFNTYDYRMYFNTQTDDIFSNFQQLFYLDTTDFLNLTFEKIEV